MTEITNKNLQILKLGNPILRLTAKELSREEILSSEIQELIPKMWSVMREAGGIGQFHLPLSSQTTFWESILVFQKIKSPLWIILLRLI